MDIQVTEYINVQKRALELNCNVPTGLAILPRNFETAETKEELFHEDSTVTIRSLWRQAQVTETRLEGEGHRFPSIQEKSFDWIGPTIFIGASMLTQNETLASIALNVLSNYITDFFKGHVGDHTVSVNIVLENVKKLGDTEETTYKQISLKGNADELNKLDIKKFKKLVE